jgi:hypothetical protein
LKTGQTEARFPWKKRREWLPKDMPWPPPGVSLTLEFRPPPGQGGHKPPPEGLIVEVHYELYDGLPLVSKWIVVRNGTSQTVRLNSLVCEILAAVEYESYVDDNPAGGPRASRRAGPKAERSEIAGSIALATYLLIPRLDARLA